MKNDTMLLKNRSILILKLKSCLELMFSLLITFARVSFDSYSSSLPSQFVSASIRLNGSRVSGEVSGSSGSARERDIVPSSTAQRPCPCSCLFTRSAVAAIPSQPPSSSLRGSNDYQCFTITFFCCAHSSNHFI